MLRNSVKGRRDEMEESCSSPSHFLQQQPAEDHFDRQRRLRKLPSVRENWALVYSFLFLACTTSAVFCIVTASWFPQSEPSVASVVDVPSLDLDTGPGGNESFTGLVGDQLDRTAFHFQPPANWMNDPCAPMYYKGYYHLFYQYNPWGAVWGNISWGHAVSTDLVHWKHLEPALLFDKWYDIGGVWSGSASIRPSDGLPILLYTGVAEDLTQTQNLAYPADPNDPELREWVKHEANPLLHPPTVWSHKLQEPRTVGNTDFRDPSTAWVRKDDDGNDVWRITVGAQYGPTSDKHGMALVYKTTDKEMLKWELEETWLSSVGGSGIWECVDFFPLDVKGKVGLDTSASGPGVKHVIKVSSWDEQTDFYAVGDYDDVLLPARLSNGSLMKPHSFTGQDKHSVIYGLQYDHGKFYAAKSFYDPVKSRRINWGWSSESHTTAHAVAKGWASVQAVPRVMLLDSQLGESTKYGDRLIQAPIEELKQLRREHAWKSNVELKAGSVQKMKGSSGGQLDIEVTFDKPDVSGVTPTDDETHPFNCSISGGSAHQGRFGPFGLLVMTDNDRREQTAVFFYISYSSKDEEWTTHFCSDQSRSSKMESVELTVFQGDVIVLPHEDSLSLRVLVDHSIIESFAQGGRTAITARVYPTVAVNEQAQVFLFNNGTSDITVRKIDVWQMASANAKPHLKASADLETSESEPLILPEIHEGIPQVDEPFLASQLASHHPASRPNSQVPAIRTSSKSLVSPALCSLLPVRLPSATQTSPSDPNQRPPCSQIVVPTSV